MKTIFSILLIASAISSCSKYDALDGTPPCIEDSIKEFSKNDCEDQTIEEYEFQGERVYLYGYGTCVMDMTSDVYDADCNYLGYIGGLFPMDTINGESFSDATFIRIVWAEK